MIDTSFTSGTSGGELDPVLLTGQIATSITREDVRRASELLQKYKSGKANLEARVIEDEQWYKLRHWEVLRRQKPQRDKDGKEIPRPEPTSAWLFNAIMNKHADAMDNYPEPNVLPREKSDQEDAQALSSILPVVLEYNDFEAVYSANWWEKLKHGTAVYGVFWNPQKENGLGDIDIRMIDLLNIFWEPGVSDVQKSRNLFVVDLKDNDLLESEYPQLKGKLNRSTVDISEYVYDDTVDTMDKSAVVDWYYKVRAPGGRVQLHYCKFVGDEILYASQNDQSYMDRGFYDHGEYPLVFDTLYPEKGTPVGFGYVAITKDPQLYIDKLGQNIMESSLMATRQRYFVSESADMNEQQFADWNNPIVKVTGDLSEARIKPIETKQLDAIYVNVMQMKIDELKETAANRDVSQGSTSGGVTAAAAIAALQEAGNKGSRDMINAAYRSYSQVCYLCIELMRQFYDEARSFRITGETPGELAFIEFSNQSLQAKPVEQAFEGQAQMPGYEQAFRQPVFDIHIKAQKRNPYSRMAQNEMAKEFYGMGFFNPDRAQEALGALEMMDFEGKDQVLARVQQGQTLMRMVQQQQQEIEKMALLIQALTGQDLGAGGGVPMPGGGPPSAMPPGGGGQSLGGKVLDAQTAGQTPYMERMVARSSPNMNAPNSQVIK